MNRRRGPETLESAPGQATCVTEESVKDFLWVRYGLYVSDSWEGEALAAGRIARCFPNRIFTKEKPRLHHADGYDTNRRGDSVARALKCASDFISALSRLGGFRIAMDVNEPVGPGNPLRQVIVNTHSPSVVSEMNAEDVLIASLRESGPIGQPTYKSLSFGCLPNTWRDVRAKVPTVPPGTFLPYLKPIMFGRSAETPWNGSNGVRVADRKDLQAALDFGN